MRQRLYQAWERFFFAPVSPLPIAVFRILYSSCVLATLLLLHSQWLQWFGVDAWISPVTNAQMEPGLRLNLFQVMPRNDHWIALFFWIFLGFCILLLLGLWTRVSSIAVFLCLASIQQRNLFITNGGDTFLRVTGFFLMFAPAGAMLSLDHWRQTRKGNASPVPASAPWAQRMIQIELALLYFISFLWKMKGDTWRNGTALYYVMHLNAIQRFPVPAWLQQSFLLHAGSWFALLLEFSLGVLIWFRPLRYPLLLLGLIFHLVLEYALNLPMIQWDILAAYVLFLDPADLARAGERLQSRLPWARRRPGNGTAAGAGPAFPPVEKSAHG
jgi:uncharacterized membrane protein YphA (DoxX/SURF4 family)